MTLIVTLSIPVSIVIALTVMYFAGESLNILTLLALMISVGLLVDNSVVVAENIFRLHRDGLPTTRGLHPREPARSRLAIVMATLTTIIVFLPVSLVEGMGQFFLLRLSIPISVALLGSLLVALVFIPLFVYMSLPKNGNGESTHKVSSLLSRAYEATFGRLNAAYTRMLAVFLRRRLDLVLVLVAVFGVTAAVAMKEVKFVDVQEEAEGQFQINVDLPLNTTLEEAGEYFKAGEKVIEKYAEELDLDGWLVIHLSTAGRFEGFFKRPRTNKVTTREAVAKLMEELPEKGGVRLYVRGDQQGGSEKQNLAEHRFVLTGDDSDILETVAVGLEQIFLSVDGVIGMKKLEDQSPSEMALVLDRERIQSQNINPMVVSAVVGYALRGQTLPRYHKDGKEIPVVVRFKEEDRDTLDKLNDFWVPTNDGDYVKLSALAEPRYTSAAKRIFREDKRTSREIALELEEGKEEETRARLMAMANRIELPEGVTWGGGNVEAGLNEDLQSMLFAGLISIIFIYLLMGFLFESFVLPLSIILTIPLASLGVYWGHFILGLDIDFLGVVGLILLVGVVVNNGIVLIDYVTRLRHEGYERTQALLLAAERRFRPIMMTALTTIGGMIPLTVQGSSSIGLSYKSFGLTLIGGLTTATLLTLLVVPVFYTFFDDARAATTGVLRRAISKRRGEGSTVEATS